MPPSPKCRRQNLWGSQEFRSSASGPGAWIDAAWSLAHDLPAGDSRPEGPGDGPTQAGSPPALAFERIPLMRLIGQIGATYLVAEGPDGLYLIDQHAGP